MHLKNQGTCAELSSETPIETQSLMRWTQRSYSPRASGLLPSDCHMVILNESEAAEFVSGVLRDVDGNKHDRWAVAKLVGEWLIGNIPDEAYA